MAKTAKKTVKRLTEEQQQALEKLKSFLRSNKSFFRLSGYAGTGKSFLICHLIEWLDEHDFEFVIAAPTNKAAKSLMQVGASVGINIEVKTVAQLLGQQPEMNEETGEEEFTSSGNAEFGDYDVMIIDEFSMIDRRNFEEIAQAISTTIDTKVIFVGDEAQLPPVKEQQPMVAISELIDDTAVLNQVVRYEGEIAVVAEQIRSEPQYARRMYPFRSSEDRTIICQPRQEWLETVTEYFQAKAYKQNPDYARLLVWRNKTAGSANRFVRSRLWGKDAPIFVPGDRLIARKPLFRVRPGQKGKNRWGVLIANSEECSVIDQPTIKQLSFDKIAYQYRSIPVKTDAGFEVNLSVLTEQSEKLRDEKIKDYVEKETVEQIFRFIPHF